MDKERAEGELYFNWKSIHVYIKFINTYSRIIIAFLLEIFHCQYFYDLFSVFLFNISQRHFEDIQMRNQNIPQTQTKQDIVWLREGLSQYLGRISLSILEIDIFLKGQGNDSRNMQIIILSKLTWVWNIFKKVRIFLLIMKNVTWRLVQI